MRPSTNAERAAAPRWGGPAVSARLRAGSTPSALVEAIGRLEARRLGAAAGDPAVRAAIALVAGTYRRPEALAARLGRQGATALALAAAAVEDLDAASEGVPSELGELAQLAALEVLVRGGTPTLVEALRGLATRLAERLVAAHVAAASARGTSALRTQVAIRAAVESCARERTAVAAASLRGRGGVAVLTRETLDAVARGLGGRA